MTRYFMHLRDDTEELLDLEGREYASMAALHHAVVVTARDLLMGDLRDGLMDLRFRIDATDTQGRTVHSLPFTEAVKIIPCTQAA